MHAESLDGLVVFNDWVEAFLFQFLPVPAQFVFVVGVEKQQEVLDVRDHLFESEVALGAKEMIGLLLQFANGIISRL